MQIDQLTKVNKTTNNGIVAADIIKYIPQRPPFLFIKEILHVNEEEICGIYTFNKGEFFYAGHFPKKPITPGVILLECMSQIGVVAFGVYLLSIKHPETNINNWITMFTDAQVEFFKSVYPGDTVKVIAKKIFWRKMKLKAQITMLDANNNTLATAIASGMGVPL